MYIVASSSANKMVVVGGADCYTDTDSAIVELCNAV